jgi:Kynureninase
MLLSELQKEKKLKFKIITPSNPNERGCQLSLLFAANGKKVFDSLQQEGIIVDWREPNVIRVSPVPLYNSYNDVYQLYDTMKKLSEQF